MGVCDWDRQKIESKLGGEGMHLVCCWVISLLHLFAADVLPEKLRWVPVLSTNRQTPSEG